MAGDQLMNLRHKKPHDSLYMLLDTMCNAFGGIILLAVLVVLLTSREKIQSATKADSTKMLRRRLELAQTNLQLSLQRSATLHATANDDRWKTQVSLLTTRQELEDEIKGIRELAAQGEKEIDANAGSDPSEVLKQLDAQIAANSVKKLAAQNSLAASSDEKKRVAARLVGLEKQLSDAIKLSQRELRLPREHDTERQAAYAIVIYGRVYFCRNADMTRNDRDIVWTQKLGAEYAAPIKSKGLDPVANAAELRAYFTAQSHNSVFIDFIALADSFPTFLRAKELAGESGIPYGWVPWKMDQVEALSFAPNGYMPRPQ
jgi:hypothetical protein